MNAERDPIMQNINVLIKVAQRQAEKATTQSSKLEVLI